MDLFFSVAVKTPLRDMSCLNGQVGFESSFWIFELKVCQHSRVGLTFPSLRANG